MSIPSVRKFAVAVVSPPGYPHSAAFDEVALGLERALVSLGHEATRTKLGPVAPPAAQDGQCIVLGANLAPRAGIAIPPGAILYNLEQADPNSKWLTPALLELYRRHPVWDYSATNAARLAACGVPMPEVVPVGYVPALTRIVRDRRREEIDVLFYGSLNERRRRILDGLAKAGVRVEAVFGVYGAARDALIARSKLILNVHYYEAKVFEVVRVSYLLANHKAVVSERGADREEEAAFADAVAFADYDELVARCLSLLEDANARAAQAEAGFAYFSGRDQASLLEPIIERLPALPPAREGAPDPWAGSRPVRVLLVPELDDASDRHETALGDLARQMGHLTNVTIGVALPRAALNQMPASIERAAAQGDGDLVLLERPAPDNHLAWRSLLGKASLFVATAAQPELRALAQKLGLTIAEAADRSAERATRAR